MMTVEVELYATLGLDKSASSQQIKQAYKELARKWHPDKATDESMKEDFGKKFQSVSCISELFHFLCMNCKQSHSPISKTVRAIRCH